MSARALPLTPARPSSRRVLRVGGSFFAMSVTAAAQTGWTELSKPDSPPAMTRALMLAYDSARRLTLLAGAGSYQQGTWYWDGASWTAHATATAPNLMASVFPAAAYDIARRRLVLFGEFSSTSGPSAETWEYDGTNWLQRSTTAPAVRREHAMVYDSSRGRVLLFGGAVSGGAAAANDTWEWDGQQWTQRLPANRPVARYKHSMTYDPVRNRTVVFGGSRSGPFVPLDDTWEWDGNDWTQMQPANRPSPRWWTRSVYDMARRKTVLFGGSDNNLAFFNDTWEWDGVDWRHLTPAHRPPARDWPGLAYDTARARVVLFGGASFFTDVWEWDGSDWTQRVLNSPPAKQGLAMTYDSVRARRAARRARKAGLQHHTILRDLGMGRHQLDLSPTGPWARRPREPRPRLRRAAEPYHPLRQHERHRPS